MRDVQRIDFEILGQNFKFAHGLLKNGLKIRVIDTSSCEFIFPGLLDMPYLCAKMLLFLVIKIVKLP